MKSILHNRFTFILLCFTFYSLQLKCLAQQEDPPVVTIDQGSLIGDIGISRDGRPFKMFLGIPYGEIPKRFSVSIPAGGWTGVRNASQYSSGCVRLDLATSTLLGTENCLDINVMTPVIPSDPEFQKPLPVLVYIYGGAFIIGSADMYGGKYFMEEEVIYVTFNYRLAAFGFLNAGIEEARGNQGLRDQVLALEWVQRNIDKFGGDPSRVTLFGESSGGTSASLVALSPMTVGKKLFSQIIIQSGGGPCSYVWRNDPGVTFANALGIKFDCPTSNSTKLVECLQKLSILDIANGSVEPEYVSDEIGLNFGPTVETYSNGVNDPQVFLKDNPYSTLQNGDFDRVPVIIGQTSHEGINQANYVIGTPELLDKLNSQFGRVMPHMFYYQDNTEDPCIITSKIKDYFFGGQGNLTTDSVDQFEMLLTDRQKTHCFRKMAAEYSKYVPTYVYNFTKLEPNGGKPAHAAELRYLFNLGPGYDINPGDEDYEFSKQLVSLWTSFAINGVPGPLWGDSPEWTPLVSGKPQQWAQLNEQPQVIPADTKFENLWKFWDSLPLKEYENK